MTLSIRSMLVIVLAAALAVAPVPALAQSPQQQQAPIHDYSAVHMGADMLLGRPLGLVATVVGTALFIASLPFSAAGGNVEQAGQVLVKDPAAFTFKRPLGEF